jgi:hypothetical protein
MELKQLWVDITVEILHKNSQTLDNLGEGGKWGREPSHRKGSNSNKRSIVFRTSLTVSQVMMTVNVLIQMKE